MPIKRRVTGAVKILDDQAIRQAFAIAIASKERRVSDLKAELGTGSAFDPDESQKEIDAIMPMLSAWKRLSSIEGNLTVKNAPLP